MSLTTDPCFEDGPNGPSAVLHVSTGFAVGLFLVWLLRDYSLTPNSLAIVKGASFAFLFFGVLSILDPRLRTRFVLIIFGSSHVLASSYWANVLPETNEPIAIGTFLLVFTLIAISMHLTIWQMQLDEQKRNAEETSDLPWAASPDADDVLVQYSPD